MRILILGAGRVGGTLASHLVSQENHVTVVDQDERPLNALSDVMDVQPIVGYASHPDVLERAGAAQADVFIAATNVDEVNIVACEVVKSLFDVEIKIARIKQQGYLSNKYKSALFRPQKISIDFVVSPEIEISKAVSRSIQIQGTSNVVDIFDDLKLLSVRCLEFFPLINTPLRLISGLYPSLNMAVVGIQRENSVFIPTPKDIFLHGDQVHFIVPTSQISEAMAAFGYLDVSRHNVTIAGCGNIGLVLAQEIERNQPHTQLKIIEKNAHYAEVASRTLHNAEILNGDALSSAIMQEADMVDCDTFISVTNDDKTNILAALLAKKHGAQRVISLLNDMQNTSFFLSQGIDSIIDQNAITVATILKIIRQRSVRFVYTLEGIIEIIEAPIDETSHILGLTIEEITLPGQAFVAALKRKDDVYLLPQNFVLSAQDRLILAVSKSTVPKIEKLMSSRFYGPVTGRRAH